MDNTQPIQAQARQALQSSGQQPPVPSVPQQAPQGPQVPGLPTPPPQVAMKLAHIALTLDPMILGTLVWRALKQHGEALNAQGIQDFSGGQPSDLPQGLPQGMPPVGGQ